MTPRAALPSDGEVQQAIAALTETTGKPPSAFALANHLGIANTTFRRQFPEVTAHLSQARRNAVDPREGQDPSPFEELKTQNTRLRRDNEQLSSHLELAIANIQRLTLENHRLQRERDEAARVTSITRARQQRRQR